TDGENHQAIVRRVDRKQPRAVRRERQWAHLTAFKEDERRVDRRRSRPGGSENHREPEHQPRASGRLPAARLRLHSSPRCLLRRNPFFFVSRAAAFEEQNLPATRRGRAATRREGRFPEAWQIRLQGFPDYMHGPVGAKPWVARAGVAAPDTVVI